MAIIESDYECTDIEPDWRSDRERRKRDTLIFIRGAVVGFGVAAVASALFGLFQEQGKRRRRSMTAESRIRKQDESGGVLGDLSYIVDESTSAFKDAVQTLDRTFESGRMAVETIQDVIDKIRE